MPPCLDMALSLTQSWLRPNKISLSMSMLELLQGPVRAPRSAPVGEGIIDSSRMKGGTLTKVPAILIKVINHGASSLGTETLVFLRPEETSLINDNYCPNPTQLKTPLVRLDNKLNSVNQTVNCSLVKQSPKQTFKDPMLKQDVFCHNVVDHVQCVTFHGQPQRKDLSPGPVLNRIKFVKGVSCVSQCLSAPSVPNVLHVATEISVGGRLQSFWEVWQKLGANPRVVSVLRDGYSLPFRERSHLSRFPLIVSKYSNPLKNKALLEALTSLIQKKPLKKWLSSPLWLFTTVFFWFQNPTENGSQSWT